MKSFGDLKAEVKFLPAFSGDGYGYGGAAVLCIGEFAIPLGEGAESSALSTEICRRWNNYVEKSQEGKGQTDGK